MWHSTFQLTNIVNLQSTSFLNFRAFCYLANYESAVYMETNKMKQNLMELKKVFFFNRRISESKPVLYNYSQENYIKLAQQKNFMRSYGKCFF